ncbi:MAG: hypothetical protein HYX68_16160 [Planctomycetes bacterium]|nr:hypothetical protein [Planctomycetota bacterium]
MGVELQLDPDVHVLRAYEEMFGPADEAARTFLAKLVTMLVGEFGDDWEQQCTDWKRLIYETVVDVKAEYGETWASLLSQAEWERPSFAIHVAKERGRT